MDRDQALGLLCGEHASIAEWNRQRQLGGTIPDLRGAALAGVDLGGADLSEINLSEASLGRAKLRGANLTGAILTRADLLRADLVGANLRDASLSGADLTEANLSGANLTRTDLIDANLARANLTSADLTRANLIGANLARVSLDGAELRNAFLWDTTFASCDLSLARSLDSVEHAGPSSIGIDTLVMSKGKIPESFLRGCGVPAAITLEMHSLIASEAAFHFCSCFISHSTSDKEFVDQLHSRLVAQKLRVWYAPTDMRGGRKIFNQVDEALRSHDKLLLVLSENSMLSKWVRHEIAEAAKLEVTEGREIFFPITLTAMDTIRNWSAKDSELGEDLAKVVREYHILDFSNWRDQHSFEAGFATLLRDLKKHAAKSPIG